MIARALVFLLLVTAGGAAAQDVARIVYLGVADDPYYEPQPSYTGLSLKDRTRPIAGAEVAMRDTRILERTLGVKFELVEILLGPDDLVVPTIRAERDAGAIAFLLDLPAETMAEAVTAEGTAGTLLFNIRHTEPHWRGATCAPDLLHTIPSMDMQADALAQHLRFKGWDRILVLSGPGETNAAMADAARRAANKFGLKVVDSRPFELSNDPRNRDLNNVTLLTGGANHDVIWLIDDEGEFGRYVPYASYDARPVIGSEGLQPVAWHWTYERHGAPQLNQRFRRSNDSAMSSLDWAAWVAIRSIVEAAQRVGSTAPDAIADFARSDEISLDLYKGVPGRFRSWNGQLRQPILLATHNAVISIAPLEGFEHQFDTLDTLGRDQTENNCVR